MFVSHEELSANPYIIVYCYITSLHPGSQPGHYFTQIPADNLKEINLHSLLTMLGFLDYLSLYFSKIKAVFSLYFLQIGVRN